MIISILRLLRPRLFTLVATIVMVATSTSISSRVIGDMVIGRVDQVVPLGSDRAYIKVSVPFDPAARPVIATAGPAPQGKPAVGDWLLVFGETKPIEGRQLLMAGTVVRGADAVEQMQRLLSNWESYLRAAPLLAILLGCIIVMIGGAITAAATTLIFAGVGAAVAWYAAYAAVLAGQVDVPQFGVHVLTSVGAAFGLICGWRLATGAGMLWQRLLAATYVFAVMPNITGRFGWPEAVSWAAVAAATIWPPAAHALVGSLLLGIGLQAQGNGALTILAISTAVALILQLPASLFTTPATVKVSL